MNTTYFTTENIDEQAKTIQKRIIKQVNQRSYKIQKNLIALLIFE